MNGSGKHSSLLWYGNNNGRKKFYGHAPGVSTRLIPADKLDRLFLQALQPSLIFEVKAEISLGGAFVILAMEWHYVNTYKDFVFNAFTYDNNKCHITYMLFIYCYK